MVEISRIKEIVSREKTYAQKTLEGDTDGYDGADAARTILYLCTLFEEVLSADENKH